MLLKHSGYEEHSLPLASSHRIWELCCGFKQEQTLSLYTWFWRQHLQQRTRAWRWCRFLRRSAELCSFILEGYKKKKSRVMLLTAAGDPPRTPIQQLRFYELLPTGYHPCPCRRQFAIWAAPPAHSSCHLPRSLCLLVLGYVAVTAGVLQSTGGKREREPLWILPHELSISAQNPILPFVLVGPSAAQVGLRRVAAVKHKGRYKHQRHLGNYPDEYSKDRLKSTLST